MIGAYTSLRYPGVVYTFSVVNYAGAVEFLATAQKTGRSTWIIYPEAQQAA